MDLIMLIQPEHEPVPETLERRQEFGSESVRDNEPKPAKQFDGPEFSLGEHNGGAYDTRNR